MLLMELIIKQNKKTSKIKSYNNSSMECKNMVQTSASAEAIKVNEKR